MDITSFVLSEILPLAAALWVIGALILKPIKQIPDEFIPVILLIIGMVGAFGILKGDIATSCIQGALATGLAVLANTSAKQLTEYVKK